MTFKEHLQADLPVFFDTTEYGTEAIFLTNTVNVQRFVEQNDFGDAFYTRIVGRSSDFPGIAKNDIVTVDGTDYGVVSFRIDEFNQIIEVFLNE